MEITPFGPNALSAILEPVELIIAGSTRNLVSRPGARATMHGCTSRIQLQLATTNMTWWSSWTSKARLTTLSGPRSGGNTRKSDAIWRNYFSGSMTKAVTIDSDEWQVRRGCPLVQSLVYMCGTWWWTCSWWRWSPAVSLRICRRLVNDGGGKLNVGRNQLGLEFWCGGISVEVSGNAPEREKTSAEFLGFCFSTVSFENKLNLAVQFKFTV